MVLDNFNLPNIPDLADLPGYSNLKNLRLFRKVREITDFSKRQLFKLFLKLTSGVTVFCFVLLLANIFYQMKFQNLEGCSPTIVHSLVDLQKYDFDSYDVMTEDGYTLQIFRLRNKRMLHAARNSGTFTGDQDESDTFLDEKISGLDTETQKLIDELNLSGSATASVRSKNELRVIYLQHGLGGSAGSWLVGRTETALAKVLADKGYDVWMGNTRGNYFSRTHSKYEPYEADFWKFNIGDLAKD
jgi:hypothetical protein